MTPTSFPIATQIAMWAMIAYPVVDLIVDMFLKFVLHDPTITADVTSTYHKRVMACLYLSLWTIILVLHFGFLWFDG
jgi:hypothetical protein